jgi:fumarate reductase flavoprotein subunit
VTPGESDVLVLGGGGAGLCAALSAAETGAGRVTILEAAAAVGGSTALSAGSYLAAGTAAQASAGWGGDTPEAMLDHLLTASAFDVETGVVRTLCEQSAPTLDWLESHGARLADDGLYRAGRETFPRSHRFAGQGPGLVAALCQAALKAGVQVLAGHRATDLIVADGKVGGAMVGRHSFPAHSVVLATGGFAHDAELVRRHLGADVAWPGASALSPAAETARGDGLRLTAGLACRTCDRGGTVVRLNPSFPAGDLYLPPWLLLADASGRRFADESAPPQTFREAVGRRGGRCFAIFDEEGRKAFGAPRKGLLRGISWAEAVAQQLAAGRIASAPDAGRLAAALGLEPGPLSATMARYDDACRAGADRDFEKPAEHLRPVRTPPFYAIELRPHIVLISGFGLEIDRDGAVRGPDGSPVAGLFAAGEVTGNAVGARYPGQGAAITNALVFGRIAGHAAAHSGRDQAAEGRSPSRRV